MEGVGDHDQGPRMPLIDVHQVGLQPGPGVHQHQRVVLFEDGHHHLDVIAQQRHLGAGEVRTSEHLQP